MIQKGDKLYIHNESGLCDVISVVFGRYYIVRNEKGELFMPRLESIIAKQEEFIQ